MFRQSLIHNLGISKITPAPLLRTSVRLYSAAGYGNSTSTIDGKTIDTGTTADYVARDSLQSISEGASKHQQVDDTNETTNTKHNKASAEVKDARKKLSKGDQDAVRDYTASID